MGRELARGRSPLAVHDPAKVVRDLALTLRWAGMPARTCRDLVEAGVVVGATASGITAEVLELPQNTFRVASLFQPHIGSSQARSIHPLLQWAGVLKLSTQVHRPPVTIIASGRPCPSTAWSIFVVRPPRERPMP